MRIERSILSYPCSFCAGWIEAGRWILIAAHPHGEGIVLLCREACRVQFELGKPLRITEPRALWVRQRKGGLKLSSSLGDFLPIRVTRRGHSGR